MKKLKISLLGLLMFCTYFNICAQEEWKLYKNVNTEQLGGEENDSKSAKSNTQYNRLSEEALLEELLNFTKEESTKSQILNGYRIQIFFSSGTGSKAQAIQVQNEFEAKYPEIACHLSFQSPNFKVRVGDFRTKLDAERAKALIIKDFPSAFITKDEIAPPLLESQAE
jgi:hypothetical protein